MFRDPEDDFIARRSLDRWLREKPDSAIIVASVAQTEEGQYGVDLRVSHHTAGGLLAAAHALVTSARQTMELQPNPVPETISLLDDLLLVFGGGPVNDR